MKRKPIINRRFKYLMAVFIILFGQLLPLYPQQAEAAADNWLNFKFDEFSQNTVNQFTLNGHATIAQGQNIIRLTQPTTLQSGAAFNNTALCPRDNYSFSTAFSFKMSNPSAQGASDGLTFTLQTGTTSQNMNGGGLGYYGISPSFAVKYDTFKNDVYKDPSSNYVGLAVNGDVVNQAGWYTDLDSTSFKLSNGTQYYTWIDYNSSTQNVQVHLGTSPDRVNASKVLDVNGIDLSSIFGGQSIHAGFTGSTGLPNYETHDIHNWYFVNAYAPIETLNPNNTYKVNEAPVVPGDSKVTAVNTPASGQVIGTDPDGDPLTYTKGATDPKNGTVTVNADGTWTYTPTQDFIGTDSFTVIANDGKCATAEATIDVEVSDSVPPTTPQPPNACGVKVALINGSFEEPPGPGSMNGTFGYYEDEVPGWKTTDDTGGVKWIEIWDYAEGYPDPYVKQQPAPVHGNRYAELNASGNGMLYQDVETTPGQTIYWRLSHKGLYGEDTMQLRIGPATADPYDTSVIDQMTDGNTAWGTYTGSYTVPAGQTMTRFGFEAVSTSNGSIGHGNHLDDIFLGTGPCVIAEKSVSPAGDVFEGNELTYEVTVKNEGGDVAANTVFEDVIPAGTEYVPGSMKMVSGTNTVDLTDADDTDAGHFDGSKVIIRLGNLQNTNDLPEGITLQFKVKALSSHIGQTVTNKAAVDYKNLLIDKDETTESNETTSQIIEREVVNACTRPVALINGSFEEPAYTPGDPKTPTGPGYTFPQDENVPGWHTTDSTGRYDIFVKSLMEAPGTPAGNKHEVIHGEQFAEINSFENATLYQDVETTPGQTIYWRLAHKGRFGVDTMAVNIGSGNTAPGDLPTVRTMSTDKDAWKYYSGTYTVPAGQTVTRFGFEAIASANGNITGGNFIDDVFLGTEPCVVAEKSVSPAGQAFVGDELTYEVNIKNAGGDVAANTVFEDAIPAGTEYVPGSMKIVSGPNAGKLTDADDQDAGYFDGNKVMIRLGELPNTNVLPDGIKVQFKVKALSSHVGQTVTNKAMIGYKNLLSEQDETSESNEVTSNISDKPVSNACVMPVALINGSFEKPVVVGSEYSIEQDNYVYALFPQDVVPGWNTTASDGLIELWDESVANHKFKGIKGGVPDGKQVAELNANEASTLYQDVKTTPGQTIYWRLSHQGGADIDTAEVRIGSPNLPFEELSLEASLETGPDEWKIYSGTYTVPAGQTTTRFAFESTDEKDPYAGNILDDIFLGTEPCVVAEKSVSPAGQAFVGDEITYEVNIKNAGGDVAANTVFEDEIPAGTEYVPGSMKIVSGTNASDLTDADDQDAGHFDGSKVIIRLGDVPNTNDLPNGITVQFKVKALSDRAGDSVSNKANVGYKNLLTNEDKTTPSNEVTTSVEYREPKLEANKTAELFEKATGNTDAAHPEVGDTLLYTIQTRNTVTGSLVTNLTISDEIPAGLEYVPGTLKVDDVQVTDDQDGDKGHFVNGKIFGQFGDVTGTGWHKVTFQVKVQSGQAGNDIRNVAEVDGDNVTTPSTPEQIVEVYPRETSLESTKTAELFEKATGNTDAAHPEVGDTLQYTIQTRNNIKDSLVKNFTISDEIPAGLEYVPGTLKVKDVQVTDDQDGDKGHFADGKIFAQFGDVTDTEWYKVTFQVKVLPGQAGKVIRNVAVVDGDNVNTPKTPREEVEIYPHAPSLESTKTAEMLEKAAGNTDAANPEVGDTLLYTIQTHNTIEDSLVTNLTISDEIPAGLEYVAGTLKVDDLQVTDAQGDDAGHFANGKVFAQFGDVTDTEWHKVTFQVKVLPGQAGKDIRNVAAVDGDNITTPGTPEEVVEVYPRETALESTKTAELFEKATGNTDAAHPEVGDTLLYTIQTHNKNEDSLVTNLTISDVIPAGLEYVAGTLKVDNAAVTDDQDGDAGHFANGKVFAKFGDVSDTKPRKVTFQVKVLPGQAGKDIRNVAEVDGDNVTTPSTPEEVVEVYPRESALESTKTSELLEKAAGNTDAAHPEVGDTLSYTIQTRNTASDSLVTNLTISDEIPAGLEYVAGTLKVNDVQVTDNQDGDKGHFANGKVLAQFGDVTDTKWQKVTFQVKVLPGQAGKDIRNVAVVDGDNITTPSTPEEVVEVYPRENALESTKTAELLEKAAGNTDAAHAEVGDTLSYTIQTRNTASDSLVTNLTISDEIPAGLEYVAGTLKVNDVQVTDNQDGDKGHFANGKVFAQFGDVTDTEWHQVTFQVKVLPGQAGKDIRNVAVVDGDNINTPSTPEEVVEVYPRETALESTKTAELFEKAAGNTDAAHPEIGDTLLYTIQTRNTASDSRVTNLTITDEIPAGLEYVAGTLKVNDVQVTDDQDGDKGHFANGKIFAGFGDVTDTELRKVTFQVKVLPGQAGKNIINIAAIEGDNVGTPDRPRNEVEVYPRNPQIETDKSVANTNVTKATYEVGDTITYTIRVRGVVNDTYLENLTITDTLPAGLEYVPGSLKVDGVTVTDPKDDDAGHSVTGDVYGSFGNVKDTDWHTLEFQAIILPGQGGLTIENTARVTGDNIDQPGEPTEKMVVEPEPPVEPPVEPPIDPPTDPPTDPPVNPPVDPDPPVTPPVTPPAPVMESRKTSRDLNGGTIAVGDTLEYTISARNTVAGSYVSNLVIADILPEGLVYVAGSLKVDGVSVTDLADGDKGQYVNGKVSGNFGRITDTEWHTITFQATVKAGQAGHTIENIGEVTGDNVTSPEKPSNVIEVTDNENNNDNNTNPGGTGDSDSDSNEDPNGNSNEDTDGDSNGNPDEDSNGDTDGDSNTGVQTPDDHDDSTLGVSDSTPRDPDQSGDQGTNEPNRNKLPNTATNMYSFMLAGAIMLFAGLLLLRRKKV